AKNGPHTSQHALAVDIAGNIIAGGDGGVWRFNPAANRWTDITSNLAIAQLNGVAGHPTDLGVAFGDSRFNRTQQFTNNLAWPQVAGDDAAAIHVNPKNPNIVYRVTNLERQNVPPNTSETTTVGSLQRSTNGGAAGSWTSVLTVPFVRYFPFAIDSVNTA